MNSLCSPNWKRCISWYSFTESRKWWISLVTSPNKLLSQPFIDCPCYINPIEMFSSWIWLLCWVALTNILAGLYFHIITALIVLCCVVFTLRFTLHHWWEIKKSTFTFSSSTPLHFRCRMLYFLLRYIHLTAVFFSDFTLKNIWYIYKIQQIVKD